MTQRLVEFAGIVLLCSLGNIFLALALELKIRRTGFAALLCLLDVLLFLPFLLFGQAFLYYGAFALSMPARLALLHLLTRDTKPILFLGALLAWILGPGNMLFANLLQPIAVQIWGDAKVVSLGKSVLLILVNAIYWAIILLVHVKDKKEQLTQFADWKLILQFCFILIVNAMMLSSMAVLCSTSAAALPKRAGGFLLLSCAWYLIASFVNFLTFWMMFKMSERDRLAANLAMKEMEAQLEKECAAINEHNTERLKRWQHDTNNLIAALRLSTTDKQTIEALDELSTKISVPAAAHYTENTLLNNCLTLKAEKARSCDVRLAMQIVLPEEVPLSDIELIRIFSNLLDNAIRAAAVLPDIADRVIEVVCKENAGYLYISTRNRFIEGATPSGSGRGSEILRKFEERDGYHFTSEPRGGEWFAQLAVKL